MEQTDVTIVGAGPAGLAAAIRLAEAGLRTTVVDERAAVGGQIYRSAPDGLLVTMASQPRQYARGRQLVAAASNIGATWRLETTAWGILPDRSADERARQDGTPIPDTSAAAAAAVSDDLVVALSGPDGIGRLRSRFVLLAAGAYDRPVPFPGWDLPGVMTAGAVQTLAKSQGIQAGEQILLHGTHPFLLVVASQLVDFGAERVHVAFEHGLGDLVGLRRAARTVRHVGRAREIWGPLRKLRRTGVPIEFGRIVDSAVGDERLEGAWIAPRGDPEARSFVPCDVIGTGFGFFASSELARQAGCANVWSDRDGGWIVTHDTWMRTSRPNVFVAGEVTGVAGAGVAELEGRLAALGILVEAEALRLEDASSEARPLRRRLRGLKRFADLVNDIAAVESRTAGLPEHTIICRCEDVTIADVRDAIEQYPGVGTVNNIKLLTRAGMGYCQGRYCAHSVADLACAYLNRPRDAVEAFTPRIPAKPITLGDLVAAEQDTGER